jgi:hypothetical protein
MVIEPIDHPQGTVAGRHQTIELPIIGLNPNAHHVASNTNTTEASHGVTNKNEKKKERKKSIQRQSNNHMINILLLFVLCESYEPKRVGVSPKHHHRCL